MQMKFTKIWLGMLPQSNLLPGLCFLLKQLGVLGTIEDSQLPYFIQWLSSNHPSSDGKANSHISKIEISGDEKTIESWLGSSPKGAFKDVEVIYKDPSNSEGTGIISVTISTPNGEVVLD
jgi:hypothetical protein